MRYPLLVILIGCLAYAAEDSALYIDLSGEWRFQQGDSPDFAKPEFDDSGWSLQQLPGRDIRPRGTWWLRRTQAISEWAAGGPPLVLTLGGMNEVYEVFVNGTRIAAVGAHTIWEERVARPRSFPIPAGLIPDGARRITVALRLWRSGTVPPRQRRAGGFGSMGPYLLTASANAPLEPGAASLARRERLTIPGLMVAIFEGALAVLLLLGWLIHRERKELAFLAGLLGSEIVAHGVDFAAFVFDWPHGVGLVSGLNRTLSPLWLVYFAAQSLGAQWTVVRVAAWIPFLIHAAGHLRIGTTGGADAGTLMGQWSWLALALMAFVAVLGARSLSQAVRRRAWREVAVPSAILLIALLMGQRVDVQNFLGVGYSLIWAGMIWRPLDFLMMLAALAVTVHLLREFGAARQRLRGEMEAARAVQQLLLTGAGGSSIDFAVDAEYRPAQEVGGDFWQSLPFAGRGRIVAVGDVSGKGLKAAMVVSLLTGALRNRKSDEPAGILAELNQVAVSALQGGFVTAAVARLEQDCVTIANAGHPAPYLGGVEVALDAGLPLGIDPEATYQSTRLRLDRQLTFVSDGVVEAASTKGELFGFERTAAIATKTATEIADAANAWGQNDDITVVTIQRKTSGGIARTS